MSDTFDLIIIGSGPGGYIGAIRAAQLKMKVALIEKDPTLGGTCLNVGCIPSKALLQSSEHYYELENHFSEHGIHVEKTSFDCKKMLGRKNKIVKELTDGIAYLMKKNKVTVINGFGKLISQNQVQVTNEKGEQQTLNAKNVILATGSIPNSLPGLDYDGKKIISSTEALDIENPPKRMLVIGAGAIGLELGSVWSRLGTEVTIVEYGNKICGPMDDSLSKRLLKSLKGQGIKFILNSSVTEADTSKKEIKATYKDLKSNESHELTTDVILVAAGRIPFSKGLGLEDLGIEKDKRGTVLVNNHYQTKFNNVYAIGDLIPGPMLAHKAEEEGVAVAEIIAGQAGHVNYKTVPSVIYTDPEFSAVGRTEQELKSDGVPFKSGTFPFSANARAKAAAKTDGMVKVLAHKETDEVLGVHILGPNASELIHEAVVIMEFSGSAEDLARSFHAHPTLSEVIREAALNVDKMARQM